MHTCSDELTASSGVLPPAADPTGDLHRDGDLTPSGDGERGGDNRRGDLGQDGGREPPREETRDPLCSHNRAVLVPACRVSTHGWFHACLGDRTSLLAGERHGLARMAIPGSGHGFLCSHSCSAYL
eukprot:COSAG01_NODE_1815_length_9170_cov_35.104509_3_plen_126_part_00